jgi:predicted Fe-Mo cluster-binding NifX family protein
LKIAVSAVTESLDAQIDPRFGRCPCFVIVDSETMGFEAIPNTSQSAPSGAGIQAAQTIANKGVKLLLTGRVGPNAFQVLSSAGVEIITSVSGTVREAIERFKTGQLRDTTTLSTPTMGFGVGSGYGSGMGMGRGRGMGKGRGRGVRRWQTTEPSFSPPTSLPPTSLPPTSLPPTSHPPTSIPTGMSREQEIQTLESQMKVMQQQMDQIRKRLNELQK